MRYRSHFILLFLSLFFANLVFAGSIYDPNNPGQCDPDIPFCDCPFNANIPPCPVDGGVIALLAAGVGLGIKRMRDVKKQLTAKEI